METQQLTLRVGESHEIQLPSRGASGMQLLFTLDPTDVVSITRRDATAAEQHAQQPDIGGALPAYFVLQGLKAGHTQATFVEQPARGRSGPETTVATYQLTVTE